MKEKEIKVLTIRTNLMAAIEKKCSVQFTIDMAGAEHHRDTSERSAGR